jgi:hypothetical protein
MLQAMLQAVPSSAEAVPKQCSSSAQAVLEQSGSHVVASSMLSCRARRRRDEVVSGSERDTVKQGEQRRPEAGKRPKMKDNPIRPPETRHVSQVARCGAKTRSGGHASRCRSPDGAGAECMAAQTAVALRKGARTTTTSTAGTPRRWPPPASGYARLLNCFAVLSEGRRRSRL